ncbi:hypothetical protein GCM10027299_00410 [Larkinella ripae]
MKQLVLFVLILAGTVACQKAERDAAPTDLLYRKWQLTELKGGDGNWKTISSESRPEFRADGTIRYDSPKPPCCSPIEFERQQDTLKLTQFYLGAGCEHVDCALPSAYKMVSVTADELVLESIFGPGNPIGSVQIKYKPVH